MAIQMLPQGTSWYDIGIPGDKGCGGCSVIPKETDEVLLVWDARGRYWHIDCMANGLAFLPRTGEGPFPLGNRCPKCGKKAMCPQRYNEPMPADRAVPPSWTLRCVDGHDYKVTEVEHG